MFAMFRNGTKFVRSVHCQYDLRLFKQAPLFVAVNGGIANSCNGLKGEKK